MSVNKKSLESLLYVEHQGDLSDNMNENIHLYVFNLIFDIVSKNEKEYKNNKYYKKSKAFKDLCDDIRINLPKSIFVKDGPDYWVLNDKHKKYINYLVYSHALKFILVQLGF